MEIPLLKDIVIIFALSILVIYTCTRLRIPTIVAFLITGILCGPQGLGLISAVEEVKILAEIGIVVLLFTVGLELSIKKVLEYKRYFFIAGPIQVCLTTLAGILVGQVLGRPFGESVFLGFLLSLSSTAIVMRVLQERAETNSPQGHLILGILIFQDIIVVPMMLVTPLLVGEGVEFDKKILYLLGEGILILAVTLISAIKLVPTLLYFVAKTRSREMFLLTLFVICFSVAWITSSIGLSLALGAFLAGLTISQSEYSYQAIGDVLPFQDIFTSFFFVSIGMLLDINFFVAHIFIILLITVGIFLLKSVLVTFIALILGAPMRLAVLSGMALAQVGEFSFVLAASGIAYGIGMDYHYQLFIAIAVLTMSVTPIVITLSPLIANLMYRLPLPAPILSGVKIEGEEEEHVMKDHVIIIGFGLCGRNLARSTKEANVPYAIVDMNPETVHQERRKGESIFYGDATTERVLEHVNIPHARVVAVLVNDPIACLRIVENVRRINPSVHIIARTHYVEEMTPLFNLGADDVIPDELGSSVEIFMRVLKKFSVPIDQIEELVATLRAEGYEMLRPTFTEMTIYSDLKEYLQGIGVKMVTIEEGSPFSGKSLEETELRKRYGITVLAIKRGKKTLYNIDSKTRLYAGDDVGIIGTKDRLEAVEKLFNPKHS